MPPQRRQSFAPSSNAPKTRQGILGRKRAQSLVPSGAQQLIPRKSILKSTPFTFEPPQQLQEPQPQPQPQPQPAQRQEQEEQELERLQQQPQSNITSTEVDGNDDDDDAATESIDYRAEVSDNTSRKSIGRRVSFAPFAQYRVFDTNDQNTNSSGGPSSSPSVASPQVEPSPSPPSELPPVPRLSNENDYPGRRVSVASARRVSMASEYGEASMSMDEDEDEDQFSEPPTVPIYFAAAAAASNEENRTDLPREDVSGDDREFEDDEEDDNDDDDNDMDITEAIALNIRRKRSLSIAQQQAMARRSSLSSRRRSSVKFVPAPSSKPADDEDEDVDGEDMTTTSLASQESESPVEFTIPLEKSLKEPKPPSDAWLALQAVTHSQTEGDDDDDGEEMELTNALSRLRKARASFDFVGQGESPEGNGMGRVTNEDPSFTSTDDSMDNSMDMGDRTLNITSLMGGVRNLEISGDDSERDTGTMDEDFARPILPVAPLNVQRKENLPPQAALARALPGVFSAPVQSATPTIPTIVLPPGDETDSNNTPSPPTTEARTESAPPSQLKPPASSVFTAPPSPSRIPVPSSPTKPRNTLMFASPSKKRPAPPEDTASAASQPSPAKKRILETSTVALNRPAMDIIAAAPPPPDDGANPKDSSAMSTGTKTGIGMRRPSGYFAQRRSLAPGVSNPLDASPSAQQSAFSSVVTTVGPPKKAQMRRASIAVAPKGQVQDENVLSLTSLPRSPAAFKGKATAIRNPLTPEEDTTEVTREEGDSKSIMMDTEESDQTMRWRENVASEPPPSEADYGFDDGLPSISIEEFLMMTSVKFMDELTIPRRSTIHPSQLQRDRRDSSVLPSMAEFVTAMIVHIPQLELYSWVAKDLQTWIANSKKIYREAEDEVAKVTPSLFREFSQANEEGRAELLHQLKLIKANKHSAAKEKWYEWKYQWVENLHEIADKGFADLEQDRAALSDIINKANDLLPALRQQHAQILLDLEKERAEVEEIERSDPGYLEELKVTIDEQNQLLEVYRTDFAEGNAKLERFAEKLTELEAQKQENIQAIEDAERKIALNKTSTRAEVFRIKDELESLQVLHSWRIAKVTQQMLELVFDELFVVTVPCTKYRPVSAEISVSRVDSGDEPRRAKRRLDPFPLFSDLVVCLGEAFVRKISTISTKKIVESLSDFWTSCAQIRTQLTFLAIKYPLSLAPLAPPTGNGECNGLKAVVSILLPSHKAKALVAFLFDEEVLARWPFAIPKLQCEVRIMYGTADSEEMKAAVLQRLSEASVEDNHACLLDACVEAASRYEV